MLKHTTTTERTTIGFCFCRVCGWSRSCPTEGEAQAAAGVHALRHLVRATTSTSQEGAGHHG